MFQVSRVMKWENTYLVIVKVVACMGIPLALIHIDGSVGQ